MLLIHKSQANIVVLTLTEKMVDTTSAFCFVLTNDSTGEVKSFSAEDTSTGTTRYNQFIWTENSTENLYTGTVSLSEGQWSYKAYEVSQSSPNIITLTGNENLLETGRVVVIGAAQDNVFFDEDETLDNVVYE